jgi:outer membrane lipoprotein LolB
MRTLSCALALSLVLLLTACTSTPLVAPINPDWERHSAAVGALGTWELAGRLNVRQNGRSDTVQINWAQQQEAFNLRLSGSLGLGAVHVAGTPSLITVEKSGEEPVTLPGMEALTRDYFGYDFPAAQLLFWVRGLPDPALPATTTLDANQFLGRLLQTDPAGQIWELTYDRYQAVGTVFLPGRIRLQREGLQLTFLINAWLLPNVTLVAR